MPEDLRVERAGEATVAGERQDRHRLYLPALEQRQPVDRRRGTRRPDHQLHHPVGERAHRLDPQLRAAKAGARDELHRLRDLSRVGDGADAPPEILNCCHLLAQRGGLGRREAVGDLLQLHAELLAELVRDLLLLPHLGVDRALRPQVLAELVLVARDVLDGDRVEVAVRAGVDRHHLLLERPRRVLRLVERRHHPLAASEHVARRLVELGAELRERLELAVLREVEAEPPGHLPHRLHLGVAAHARDGDADVDRRPHARVEELGLEEDLAVRDRDHVRRDVRGDVTRLRLDDGQRRQGACAELVRELARALEQPRVEIEDVARERLAARRAAAGAATSGGTRPRAS